MLVYFEPAAICDMPSDLLLAPLPAKKNLWEAGDEFLWKAESEREPGTQTYFGLASNGELVEVDDGQPRCSDAVQPYRSLDAKASVRGTANWENWCSGMDGFGGLIMLAASLVSLVLEYRILHCLPYRAVFQVRPMCYTGIAQAPRGALEARPCH